MAEGFPRFLRDVDLAGAPVLACVFEEIQTGGHMGLGYQSPTSF